MAPGGEVSDVGELPPGVEPERGEWGDEVSGDGEDVDFPFDTLVRLGEFAFVAAVVTGSAEGGETAPASGRAF